jgi:hypothetical protein
VNLTEWKQRHAHICGIYNGRCQYGDCPERGFLLSPNRRGRRLEEYSDAELKPFCAPHYAIMRGAMIEPGERVGYEMRRGEHRPDLGIAAVKRLLTQLAANDPHWKKRVRR